MIAPDGGQKAAPKKRAPKRRRPGEGSIYRRGDRWTGSVDLGYEAGPDGKRRRRRITVNGETAEEVARGMRRVQARMDVGLSVPDGQSTVADHLRAWLDTTKAGSVRPRSLEHFRGHIENHLAPFLGHHKLARLEPMHVQALIADKLKADLLAQRSILSTAEMSEAAAATGREEVVLLSPAAASFDQYPDFEARGEAFRAAVLNLGATPSGHG